eukprot:CAMPEP_0115869864 /NCGR_PEP_ID=MMETSP0287-20121206/22028_1 /TAXON_ID=412157 /ORGANISM="Chrysochromulina rotalis, Strain UIO044" /LENGTH=75 /DNA_ID=CAMNT_0003324563 /DNA_START=628 /DNA_END=855 /DNA_ORIENTATION=-
MDGKDISHEKGDASKHTELQREGVHDALGASRVEEGAAHQVGKEWLEADVGESNQCQLSVNSIAFCAASIINIPV